MKKRFNEQQIISILTKAGIPARELCRKYGVSDATFYTWSKKYAGLDVSEARRLKALEDGNAQLKKLLDAEALKIALSQKYWPSRTSASMRYQPLTNREDHKLQTRIKELELERS